MTAAQSIPETPPADSRARGAHTDEPDRPGDHDALAMLARPMVPSARYPLLVDVFLAWAERAPEQVAVVHGERTWTYRILCERAQAIAAVLRHRSALAADAVAVIGAPGPGLIASLLGTLLSGRVLVPLDHELPGAPRHHGARGRGDRCAGRGRGR